MPGCSVIVCTQYRPDPLARCLGSLTTMDFADPEVIVVDNTEGDPETKRISTRAGARYVVATAAGLSRARNAGIAAATGELIAFIDDDAIADPAWLSRHAEVHADDSVTASTGRILPMSTEDGAGWFDLGEEPFVVDRSNLSWFELANFGGLGTASNMVLKRRVFERGVRFRETLGLGADLGAFEEYYLFFQIIKGGARVAHLPAAVVRHPGPELSSERTARAHRYNAAYLTLLLVEEPEFRHRTVRYALQRFRRQPLPWRHGPPLRRLEMLAAGSRGPLLYLRSRRARR